MQELIEYLVRELVDDPDSARVEPVDDPGGTVYQVHVAPEDLGKVIGRRGRIANALRVVAKAASLKQRVRASVEVISQDLSL
jgi:predicted RNA-binding protein YlqC (UPF0109 family)